MLSGAPARTKEGLSTKAEPPPARSRPSLDRCNGRQIRQMVVRANSGGLGWVLPGGFDEAPRRLEPLWVYETTLTSRYSKPPEGHAGLGGHHPADGRMEFLGAPWHTGPLSSVLTRRLRGLLSGLCSSMRPRNAT